MLMNPGDILRVNDNASFDTALQKRSIVIMIKTYQCYWDYGDGECGYVDVADVMHDGQIFEIACTHLEPIDK